MDNYYLDISLHRWAIIQYANHIWNQPKWKEHLAKTSVHRYISEIDTLPIELQEELDKLIPSRSLKDELKFAIGSMGTRLRKWLRNYSNEQNNTTWVDFIDYLDHIHWSHLGCIDVKQSEKSLYESGLLPMTHSTWLKLCESCNEECIIDFWKKISQDDQFKELMQKVCSTELQNDSYLYHYWRLRMENNIDEFEYSKCDYCYGDISTIDEYMFVSSHKRFVHSFEYFCNRFDNDQRKSCLRRMVAYYYKYDFNWLRLNWEQHIDSIMFILRQYKNHGFEEALVDMIESSEVISLTLTCWPCDANVLPVIEDVCVNRKFTTYRLCLMQLLRLIQFERAYIGHDSRARKVFCDLWNNENTCKIREAIGFRPLDVIFRHKDMESLKYIVTHQRSWEGTERVLMSIVSLYTACVFPYSIFFKTFLRDVAEDDVREWFKRKLPRIANLLNEKS